MDKEKTFNQIMEKIRDRIKKENEKDYDLCSYTTRSKTRILNRSYINGYIYGQIEIIETLCGFDYMVKAYKEVKEYMETNSKICEGIYQYLSR